VRVADVAVRPGVQQAGADCGKAYKVACYQRPKSSRLTTCGRWWPKGHFVPNGPRCEPW